METTGLRDGRMALDWLSFTLPYEGGLDTVKDLFGEPSPRPMGIRGYSNSASILDTGVVGWSPERPQQGVHVQLTSSALSRLVEVDTAVAKDLKGFIRYLFDLGAKIRRLDVALDDREGQLSMSEIRSCVETDAMVTRWRIVDRVHRMKGGQGETVYFGSRASESFLRIYNKQAERMDQGEEDPGHWVRVELEMKGDKANLVAARYVFEGIAFVVGLLRGLIEFKEPGQDTNKTRWPVARWWAAFLSGFEKCKLAITKEKPTIEGVKDWLRRQVAPSLAFVVRAEGGAMDWLYRLLQEGGQRLSPFQQALLQADSRMRAAA